MRLRPRGVARPRLGSRGAAAHLRALLRARPRHRARRLGSRAAEDRARRRVRGARGAPRARAPKPSGSPSSSGCSTPSATRCTRRSCPGGWDRRSTSRSTRSASSPASSLWERALAREARVTKSRRSRSTSTAPSATRARSGATGSCPRRALARGRPRRAPVRPRRGRRGARPRRGRQLAGAARAVQRGAGARLPPSRRCRERGAARARGEGREVGVFTDAPEQLARVALAQLGADRRVSALESGAGALERLLARLGARRRRRPHARRARRDAALRRIGSDGAAKDVGDRQLDALLERLDRIAGRARAAESHRRAARGPHARRPRAARAQRVAERARLRRARPGAAARPAPRQLTQPAPLPNAVPRTAALLARRYTCPFSVTSEELARRVLAERGQALDPERLPCARPAPRPTVDTQAPDVPLQ